MFEEDAKKDLVTLEKVAVITKEQEKPLLDFFYRKYILIFSPPLIESSGHGCMYAGYFIIGKYMCMQYGDIAKANNPFRIFLKFFKIKAVNDPANAIATTPRISTS